jgi:hypothetical protein
MRTARPQASATLPLKSRKNDFDLLANLREDLTDALFVDERDEPDVSAAPRALRSTALNAASVGFVA